MIKQFDRNTVRLEVGDIVISNHPETQKKHAVVIRTFDAYGVEVEFLEEAKYKTKCFHRSWLFCVQKNGFPDFQDRIKDRLK